MKTALDEKNGELGEAKREVAKAKEERDHDVKRLQVSSGNTRQRFLYQSLKSKPLQLIFKISCTTSFKCRGQV